MNNDWMSALEALRGAMPAGEPENTENTAAGAEAPAEGGVPVAAAKGRKLNIAYEKKGRGGKPATIIYGFADDAADEDIANLAATLKKKLGVGGAARGGEILLQGDWRDRAAQLLREMGYRQ